MKLICFPYAGGSSTIFSQWNRFIHKDIVIKAVELPGRGALFTRPFFKSLEEAVDTLFAEIREDIQQGPYAFFGHSMGGLLVYKLLEKIRKENCPMPLTAFLSGRKPPHIFDEDDTYGSLPEEEFKEKIKEMGGTPPGFFDNPDLVSYFLPILKADFDILLTDLVNPEEITPFSVPFVFFAGAEENITEEEGRAWGLYSEHPLVEKRFPGGHFFLNDDPESLVKEINGILAGALIRS